MRAWSRVKFLLVTAAKAPYTESTAQCRRGNTHAPILACAKPLETDATNGDHSEGPAYTRSWEPLPLIQKKRRTSGPSRVGLWLRPGEEDDTCNIATYLFIRRLAGSDEPAPGARKSPLFFCPGARESPLFFARGPSAPLPIGALASPSATRGCPCHIARSSGEGQALARSGQIQGEASVTATRSRATLYRPAPPTHFPAR